MQEEQFTPVNQMLQHIGLNIEGSKAKEKIYTAYKSVKRLAIESNFTY